MLRAVLQSSKEGVLTHRISSEYKGITGENIPFQQFGHNTLESFLHAIPDVVRFGRNKQGEHSVFGVATAETEHISRMVASQRGKSNRKRGRPTKGFYRRPAFMAPTKSPMQKYGTKPYRPRTFPPTRGSSAPPQRYNFKPRAPSSNYGAKVITQNDRSPLSVTVDSSKTDIKKEVE